MPSLFDSHDATGNTQQMDTCASQGSLMGGRQLGRTHGRQHRRTASRTTRDGVASGSTTVLAKPKADIKVKQKSLNKIMLKAVLKTHQTMRDCSSKVCDIQLIKASSPEADIMQKQTQICAERYGKRGEDTLEDHHSCGHISS